MFFYCSIIGRLERFTKGRELPRLVVEKVPFFFLSAASCVATILAQGRAIASIEGLPAPIRIGNAFVTYLIYICQMIWPLRLAASYPYPRQEPVWEIVVAVILLAAITIGVIALGRPRRYLVTGWFWYLIMLIPVIGFVQVGIQARADRYTYLPQIGVYLLITWWAADGFASGRNRTIIFAPLAAIVLLTLAWLGWTQTFYWRDSESLWTHAIAVTCGNFIAHNDLGNYLLDRNRIDEATDQFQTSARINPNFFDAENNLGAALQAKGRTDEAIVHFEKALELQPAESARSKYAATHNNLGVALTAVERPSEAIAHFHQALELIRMRQKPITIWEMR